MSPNGLIAEWRVGCKCMVVLGGEISSRGGSAQLPVLVAAEQRRVWIWFRIRAGKQCGQLQKA